MIDYPLDTVLAHFNGGNDKKIPWTIGHSVEGVQIFGGIGSGKTTGSGRFVAHKFLKAGYGGLVLTAKPDEKKTWEDYCAATGRSDDLIIVEPKGAHYFNFLQYESEKHDGEAPTENLVQVLKTVISASEGKSKNIGNDQFWDAALDLLLFSIIDLCKLAYREVSLQKMYDIVLSLPKNTATAKTTKETAYTEAMKAAQVRVNELVRIWQSSADAATVNSLEGEAFTEAMYKAVPEKRTLVMIEEFFKNNYLQLHDKTRSIIDFSFSSFLNRLLREPVYSLFCKGGMSFRPEDCRDGKIIILNLPVKTNYKVGRDCQILFKYIWQRQMESQTTDKTTRPVFLWADEAQNFLHEHDADYQATARSSKIATVYISQNIPNYHASMGGDKSEYRVKSFLGTLATKIFHANADVDTNTYASDLIGQEFRWQTTETETVGLDGRPTKGKNRVPQLQKILRPELFARLRTGGGMNKNFIEAYIHRQGFTHDGKMNHLKIFFKQPEKN